MPDNTPEGAWSEQVNDYQLSDDFLLDDLLNQDQQQSLYRGCPPEDATDARKAFLDFLQQGFKPNPTPLKKPIPLKILLGAEGFRLYKNAIAEESQSKAFRKAVFLNCTKKFEGPQWDQRLVLWVGGPSASGKSYGSTAVVEQVSKELCTKDPNSPEGNYVVSIDGGVERDVSQMRQMVLQVALCQGYRGIKDLEKHSKMKLKKTIKTVCDEAKLNMVIPATFTSSLSQSKKEMDAYEQDPETLQVFSEVRGEVDEQFKTSVALMGHSRAWLSEPFTGEPTMNNQHLPCESKVYEAKWFRAGQVATHFARHHYESIAKNPHVYQIINDLIFFKQNDKGEWVKCASQEVHRAKHGQPIAHAPVIKLAQRDYDKWIAMNRLDLSKMNFKAFSNVFGLDYDYGQLSRLFLDLKSKGCQDLKHWNDLLDTYQLRSPAHIKGGQEPDLTASQEQSMPRARYPLKKTQSDPLLSHVPPQGVPEMTTAPPSTLTFEQVQELLDVFDPDKKAEQTRHMMAQLNKDQPTLVATPSDLEGLVKADVDYAANPKSSQHRAQFLESRKHLRAAQPTKPSPRPKALQIRRAHSHEALTPTPEKPKSQSEKNTLRRK